MGPGRSQLDPLQAALVGEEVEQDATGAAFLGSLGLAFGLAWREDERRWWALIPAGTLLALGLTALVDGTRMGAAVSGSVFLLGPAATFFALTRLRVEPQAWAIFPAGALALLAVVSATTAGGWLLPVGFIAVGVYLLWRSGALPGVSAPTSMQRVDPAPAAPSAPVPAPPSAPVPAASAVDLSTDRPDAQPTIAEAEVDASTRLDDDGAPRS